MHRLRALPRALRAHGKAGLLFAAAAGLAFAAACGSLDAGTFAPSQGEWDAATTSDGGFPGSLADASSCHPGNVATFTPTNYHPAATPAAPCDPQNIDDYYDACFGDSATVAGCGAFAIANAACVACIQTPDTFARYGPLVSSGRLVQGNVAGCIELTDPSRLSCAKSAQALAACELAACAANCPLSDYDPASRQAYAACAAGADDNGCQFYANSAACVAAGSDGGPAAGADAGSDEGCLATNFHDFYEYAVPLFCAHPSALDAGSVPMDAAAAAQDAAPDEAAAGDAPFRLDGGYIDATALGDGAPSDGAGGGASDATVAGHEDGGNDARSDGSVEASSQDADPD